MFYMPIPYMYFIYFGIIKSKIRSFILLHLHLIYSSTVAPKMQHGSGNENGFWGHIYIGLPLHNDDCTYKKMC